MPKHIAIIMDGNGRWAKQRSLPKIAGHRSGSKTLKNITETCAREGVKALTLYTFSTENWKRPQKEVNALMELLERSLKENLPELHKNGIRFNCIGRINELPGKLSEKIRSAMDETRDNPGMILTLALNYGGRQEIVDAVNSLLKSSVQKIDEKIMTEHLYTQGLPELDLIIRTSGEMRLSNFLLWQAAYAEIYVTDILWPDFDENELHNAINEFNKRDRRFGG